MGVFCVRRTGLVAAGLTALFGASAAMEATLPAPPPATGPHAVKAKGCLLTGNGYLRAQIRGARKLDIDLHNSELECDGSARPDGTGIRISFAGPLHAHGRRLRMVFGVRSATEGAPGRALPTNLTVMFEGEHRLFATRGEDKCTVDRLEQQRLGAPGAAAHIYRVIAHGFCIAPVTALQGNEKIVISRFDFAGRVAFDASPERPWEMRPMISPKQP